MQDALVLGADRLKPPSQLPLHSGSSARQSVCLPRRDSTQKVTLKQGRIWEKAFLCVHSRAAVWCSAGPGCLEDTLQLPMLSLKLYSKS